MPVIGFTNGCFDALHLGHSYFLSECRKQCDKLIVGLDMDSNVRRLKGPARPINICSVRLNALYDTGFVDVVRPFQNPQNLISIIIDEKPDIIFKGSDYEGKEVVGSDLAKVILIPRLEGFSTTSEIEKRRA